MEGAGIVVAVFPTTVQPRITGEQPPTQNPPPPPVPVAEMAVKRESRISMYDEKNTSTPQARAAVLPENRPRGRAKPDAEAVRRSHFIHTLLSERL